MEREGAARNKNVGGKKGERELGRKEGAEWEVVAYIWRHLVKSGMSRTYSIEE